MRTRAPRAAEAGKGTALFRTRSGSAPHPTRRQLSELYISLNAPSARDRTTDRSGGKRAAKIISQHIRKLGMLAHIMVIVPARMALSSGCIRYFSFSDGLLIDSKANNINIFSGDVCIAFSSFQRFLQSFRQRISFDFPRFRSTAPAAPHILCWFLFFFASAWCRIDVHSICTTGRSASAHVRHFHSPCVRRLRCTDFLFSWRNKIGESIVV